ncbi:non-hydrolyzing UDP-N-acetylglucosamine 2-epimerase [Thalassotalea maritima]|uniref:non-hydrolyzing UDP-N-acetylglucosamine 2-epimerase n=1 Tax=Thalassotalea maritima TaxID=3242416 RepID=UPI0035297E83
MKIGIIVGTRPEIIKMAPVIRECQQQNIPFFLIHSNQHYSKDMDEIFFEELQLPTPHYNLGVGSGLHSNQTGNILIKIEPILANERPDIVLVQGDTNTVLAGALAASKLNIKVGHIEAGLRSYDRMMPEETNRILTDHMSDFLFAVGPNQERILTTEGIVKEKLFVVGNTISDSLQQHLDIAQHQSNVLTQWSLKDKQFFLVTAHRASNVDVKAHLQELLSLFSALYDTYQLPVFWPIHPRTVAKLKEFELQVPDFLILSPPVGYMDFIQLQRSAKLILTDSGGIQEEACLLGVPCITLRENTERPESVEVGANVLVGRDTDKALSAAASWFGKNNVCWENPFGDGQVAKRIVQILATQLEPKTKHIVANGHSVTVVGLGYMGLPISCLMAQAGARVVGVDVNADKVALINRGQCPFDEQGMPQLLTDVTEAGFLHASTAVANNPIYLVAVPTPHIDGKCDLSYVNKAIDDIAKVATDGQLIIIESTVAPGTCTEIEQRLRQQGLQLNVVHCPERAIPGQTLHELTHNDRIIGAAAQTAMQQAKDLYASFVRGALFTTDLTTAECVKLVENTSRDVGIAFANELAQVCEQIGVDCKEVIKLANRHPRVNILNPGPGVGGHCIPIDPYFLVADVEAGKLIRLSRRINEQKPHLVAAKVKAELERRGAHKVGILGVAYKPDVDDARETPAQAIIEHLQKSGVEVHYHDPYIKQWEAPFMDIEALQQWADILLMVTEHSDYKQLNLTTFAY